MELEFSNMEKIDTGEDLTSTESSNSKIIEALRTVSPEVFTDGKIDFELLQNSLSEVIEDSEEKYGLNWNGKRRSMITAQIPSSGTLRPSVDDGLNTESTKNIIIEADNLEALKILQKSYAGKITTIYTDPPYNTGKDFVYEDDFAESIENYLKSTGQTDDAGFKVTTNLESSGRFHSNWLNMMYPRLKISWDLLSEEGSIWISIDDNEVTNLRQMMNQIFGEENFVASLIWKSKSGGANDSKLVAVDHEYILVYAKNIHRCQFGGTDYTDELLKLYNSKDENYEKFGPYRPMLLMQKGLQFTESMTYPITAPDGTQLVPEEGGAIWRWSEKKFNERMGLGFVEFRQKEGKWKVYTKQYLKVDYDGIPIDRKKLLRSVILDVDGREDTKELQLLFGTKIFNNPKPSALISLILQISENKGGIFLDMFAGSGTSGHSVINHNLKNKQNLRYILIQLPEILDPGINIQKAACNFLDSIGKPRNIAEITKERMRRVATEIREEHPDYVGDLGFKVFKLDSSNIKEWDGGTENLQKSLEEYANQIKDDRNSMDILYEVILKSGIQLTADIEEIGVGENTILSVDNCRLLACLDKEIKSDTVADIASRMVELKNANPDVNCTVLFLDSAFSDSSVKLNMSETLKQNGFGNIRSI